MCLTTQVHDPVTLKILISKSYNSSFQEIGVSKLIIHSGWNRKTRENDITLIKFDSQVNFSGPYIGSACLPNDGDDYHGATGCWVSGTQT